MKIEVSMMAGQQLKASFGEFEIISDQGRELGGQEEYPDPFSYFLASLPLCTAFYIRRFCEQRDICTDGMKVIQDNTNIGDDNYKKKLSITVKLPEGFPTKYKKALIAAANTCTVKKVVQALPEYEIDIAE